MRITCALTSLEPNLSDSGISPYVTRCVTLMVICGHCVKLPVKVTQLILEQNKHIPCETFPSRLAHLCISSVRGEPQKRIVVTLFCHAVTSFEPYSYPLNMSIPLPRMPSPVPADLTGVILRDGPPSRGELARFYPARYTWQQLKDFIKSG